MQGDQKLDADFLYLMILLADRPSPIMPGQWCGLSGRTYVTFVFFLLFIADFAQLTALLVKIGLFVIFIIRSSCCFTPFLPLHDSDLLASSCLRFLVLGSWFPPLWPPPCHPNKEFQTRVCLCGCCLQPSGTGQGVISLDLCIECNCYLLSGNILIHFKLVNLNLVNSMMEGKC